MKIPALTLRFSSLLLGLNCKTGKLGIPIPLRSAVFTSPSAEALSWLKIP